MWTIDVVSVQKFKLQSLDCRDSIVVSQDVLQHVDDVFADLFVGNHRLFHHVLPEVVLDVFNRGVGEVLLAGGGAGASSKSLRNFKYLHL